jgi:hypothetical protein
MVLLPLSTQAENVRQPDQIGRGWIPPHMLGEWRNGMIREQHGCRLCPRGDHMGVCKILPGFGDSSISLVNIYEDGRVWTCHHGFLFDVLTELVEKMP